MPAGGPGDHPLNDMLYWGLPRISPRATQLLHQLSAVLSPQELESAFDWWQLPPAAEFERQAEELLERARRKAAAAGWEVAPEIPTDARRAWGKRVEMQIRQVLESNWDPLGVGTGASAAGVYDAQIATMYRLRAGFATPSTMEGALREAELALGVDGPAGRRSITVCELLLIDVSSGGDPDRVK